MEFLADYAGFLARTATVVVAIVVVLAAVAALRGRNRARSGHLEIRKLNDFFTGRGRQLLNATNQGMEFEAQTSGTGSAATGQAAQNR